MNKKLSYKDNNPYVPMPCSPPKPVNELVLPEPDPVTNTLPYVWELVMEDMKARHEFGIKKYGTGLQPFNSRNARKDAYQEKLDDLVYTRQQIFEDEYINQVVLAATKFSLNTDSRKEQILKEQLSEACNKLIEIRGY